MTERALLTETEAAESLQVCTRTLRKARQDGKLRYIKIGRTVRYTPADLAAFIEASAQENAPCESHPTRRTAKRASGKIIPFSARH